MEKVFEIATRISTPLILAGVVTIAMFFVCLALIRKVSKPSKSHSAEILRQVVWGFFGLGLLSLLLGFAGYLTPLIDTYIRNNPVYRVRVTVVDSTNRPVNGAEIISVPSGEQKITEAGSEIVIPDSVLSQDRKLRIWAKDDGELKGYSELILGDDHYPALTILLRHDTSARIRGQVKDEDGNPVPGVSVYIQNYANEKTTTDITGQFDLAAHVAANEHVHLFVEAEGYHQWNDFIPAGGESLATISLDKKR